MPTPLDRSPAALPLHVQVFDLLRARIQQGLWRDGEAIPPEKVLCAEFEVARGTLRQALQRLEDEGHLRREQGRGTFVQTATRQPSPANGHVQTRRLAFIVPYVRDSSVSNIWMGFQDAAQRERYTVTFNHVNNDVEQQARLITRLLDEAIAGVALYPVDSEHPAPMDQFVEAGVPLVLVDRYLKALSTDFVGSDHFGGALRGVHHLLDQGHRRVGFVTWRSPATSMEHRELGYRQAFIERGIAVDPGLLCTVEGYPTVDLTSLRGYLSGERRPTAVFAANDQIAIALYRAAQSLGMTIPTDLSVVGFDNLDIVDRLEPPLTTVAQPFAQIGQTAAQLLFRRIGGERGPAQHVTIPPSLILRASTAPPQQST